MLVLFLFVFVLFVFRILFCFLFFYIVNYFIYMFVLYVLYVHMFYIFYIFMADYFYFCKYFFKIFIFDISRALLASPEIPETRAPTSMIASGRKTCSSCSLIRYFRNCLQNMGDEKSSNTRLKSCEKNKMK
jgi:hypothetical protein